MLQQKLLTIILSGLCFVAVALASSSQCYYCLSTMHGPMCHEDNFNPADVHIQNCSDFSVSEVTKGHQLSAETSHSVCVAFSYTSFGVNVTYRGCEYSHYALPNSTLVDVCQFLDASINANFQCRSCNWDMCNTDFTLAAPDSVSALRVSSSFVLAAVVLSKFIL